ncbi:MAG: hypothetical protein ACI8TQ_002148 [Planctomycetota bacterium]|jgi:uncharacterized protein YndB with AHSA1/START domain
MSFETEPTQTVKYELEVPIQAPVDKVWSTLVDETNAWWLPDFHMVGADSIVTFDAQAGGRLVESSADGGSLLWYTVQMVVPKEWIHLVGYMAPPWGGPGISMLELALEDHDGGTLLTIKDAMFGAVSEATAKTMSEGWELLFGDGLRAFVEKS